MKIQVDDQIRDATPDEVAIIAERQANTLNTLANIQLKEQALQSARAKLAKLGFTDDELKAFLGV